VEVELKNLILADFGKKNNVNVSALTQSEIRDIILGMEMAPPAVQTNRVDEIDRQTQVNKIVETIAVKTVNKFGEKMVVTTESPYE
jgi:pre-mRNA-processing factor 8